MSNTSKHLTFKVLRTAVVNFVKHQCPQMAAAMAYYMLFSLPAILLIAVNTTGYVARMVTLGPEQTVHKQMEDELEHLLGPAGADQIATLLKHSAKLPPSRFSVVAAGVMVLISASAVMMQVQLSLNTIWPVDPDSPRQRNRNFVIKRVLSFAAVFVMGLLLVLSLILSGVLAALGEIINPILAAASLTSSWVASTVTDLVVSLLLFTAVYKWLPDTRVTWKFAWLGGVITAPLYMVGKALLAMFLTRVDIGSAYGAAGSLAMLLAWFYYSALVFLLGAELTRAIEAHTMRTNVTGRK